MREAGEAGLCDERLCVSDLAMKAVRKLDVFSVAPQRTINYY